MNNSSDEELIDGNGLEFGDVNDEQFMNGIGASDSDDILVQDSTVQKCITLICTFLLTLQTFFRIPDIAVRALIKFIGIIICQINKIKPSSIMQQISNIL